MLYDKERTDTFYGTSQVESAKKKLAQANGIYRLLEGGAYVSNEDILVCNKAIQQLKKSAIEDIARALEVLNS